MQFDKKNHLRLIKSVCKSNTYKFFLPSQNFNCLLIINRSARNSTFQMQGLDVGFASIAHGRLLEVLGGECSGPDNCWTSLESFVFFSRIIRNWLQSGRFLKQNYLAFWLKATSCLCTHCIFEPTSLADWNNATTLQKKALRKMRE